MNLKKSAILITILTCFCSQAFSDASRAVRRRRSPIELGIQAVNEASGSMLACMSAEQVKEAVTCDDTNFDGPCIYQIFTQGLFGTAFFIGTPILKIVIDRRVNNQLRELIRNESCEVRPLSQKTDAEILELRNSDSFCANSESRYQERLAALEDLIYEKKCN